jgi:putative oxidoreductase
MIHAATRTNDGATGRVRTITLWILQVTVALAFLAAGGFKLAGAEQMVAAFDKIGWGQWFRYVTALLEVAGAIGLFIPRYAFYAAGLLMLVMAGAIFSHLTVLGGSPLPAIVLLLLSAAVAYLRKLESRQ